MKRREIKRRGRQFLKAHYLLLVAACLAAVLLSAEYQGTVGFIQAQSSTAGLEGQTDAPIWQGGHIDLSDVLQRLFPPDESGSNPILGRSRGVLAALVNQVSSGSILVTIASAVGSLLGSESAAYILMICAGALLFFAFWFLVQNIYPVLLRRILLECRTYQSIPLHRFLYLLRVRKWLRAAWVMFVKSAYLFFWSLTVVGGVVKRYSYYLVPYIVAENPAVSARAAISLSRRMMKGHKWQCFIFELSFLGWIILGALTLGLVNLFYTTPYQAAAFAEYYAQLRAQAKAQNLPGCELLNDDCLYGKADQATLNTRYADVIEILNQPPVELEHETGWRAFLAKWFGLILFPTQRERLYEQDQARRLQVRNLADEVAGQTYPTRLFSISEQSKRRLTASLHYVRHYSIWSLMVMFLGFSFVGWLWEVSFCLVTQGILVNRGALHGPWLPIYGSGAVLILLVLNRLRKHPVAEFLATIVLCGALEYTVSLVMELTSGGVRWWDYTGYFLNLNGRICAEGLLVFGIGGMAVVYVLGPLVDNLVQRLDSRTGRAVCLAVMAVFLVDWTYSQFSPNQGEGITDDDQLAPSSSIQVWEGADGEDGPAPLL